MAISILLEKTVVRWQHDTWRYAALYLYIADVYLIKVHSAIKSGLPADLKQGRNKSGFLMTKGIKKTTLLL